MKNKFLHIILLPLLLSLLPLATFASITLGVPQVAMEKIPGAPFNLVAEPLSADKIALDWEHNNAKDVTHFFVERTVEEEGSFKEVAKLSKNHTELIDEGLSAGTTYVYRVKASNKEGDSDFSNMAKAITLAEAPNEPFNLQATPISLNSIRLSWEHDGDDLTGFIVERSFFENVFFDEVATLEAEIKSYTDKSLLPLSTYYYRVKALNEDEASDPSNTASATTQFVAEVAPVAPSDLSATATSASTIQLTWTDNSDNELNFEVARATASEGPYNLVTTLGFDVVSFEDTGLSSNTTYYYQVTATNGVEAAVPSNTANATTDDVAPAAPSGLSATATSASAIQLSWTDNANNEDEFEVVRATSSEGTYTVAASLGPNVTSFEDTDLSPNTTYYYQVRALNEIDHSVNSNTANATTFNVSPAAPSGLSATASSASTIQLSWTDNANNEDEFEVVRATSSEGPYTLAATLDPNVVSFEDTGLSPVTRYYYKVLANNEIGSSAYSNVANATTDDIAPAAPSGLSATASSASTIQLSWTDNANNEDEFEVVRATSSEGSYILAATLDPNVVSFEDTGLSPDTRYYYKVRASNEIEPSPYSNVANAITDDVAPATPSGLSATVVSKSQINLSWTDNATNEDNYIVERSSPTNEDFEEIATLAAGTTSYNHTGLISNTRYYYRVKAKNEIDDSGYSNVVNATTAKDLPILTPTNLRATAKTISTIALAWNDNSNNEAEFILERTLTPLDEESYLSIAELPQNENGFVDEGLSSNTTYFYRVRASNKDGKSPYSNIASETTERESGPPAVPTGLTATAITTFQINLKWNDHADNETSYVVQRAIDPDGPFTEISLPANTEFYENTGLSSGTTYYYKIVARNIDGDAESNLVNATTKINPQPPTAPSGLSATAVSTVQINLSWEDNSISETNFNIERATSSSGPFELVATVGANVTSYQNFGLTANTKYYYRTRAINGDGASGYSNVVNAQTSQAPQPPSPPSSLTAVGVSTSQINLSWKDNANNETGFVIERAATSGGTYSFAGAVGANITNFQNTGLESNTEYFYKVRAINNDGTSGFSNASSGTTLETPRAPTSPTNLVAIGVSTTQINLSWDDNSESETNFEVYRATDPLGTFTFIANVPANQTFYESTGLESNTIYYYKVLASNADGKSDYTNTAFATTSIIPLPPEAPDGLTALAVSTTQIALSWNDKALNETGYEIDRAEGSGEFSPLPATAAANDTTYQNFGLSPNTAYTYRIRAFNEDGVSAYSNEVTATTLADKAPPTAPSDLFGKLISLNEVELFWTDNSNNEEEFIVERAEMAASDQSDANFGIVEILSNNITTFLDTEIEANSVYRYRIQAKNSDGNSYSNEITVITSVGGNPIISTIESKFPKEFPSTSKDTTASLRAGEPDLIEEMTFFYRGITETDFKQKEVTVDGNRFEATILEQDLDEMGLEYYFQAESGDGNLAVSPTTFLYRVYKGDGLPIPNLKFGTTVQDYQMISIPLSLNENNIREIFEDDLGPYDPARWRLFHYENGEMVERGNFVRLEPGKGYWLIAKENTTIDTGEGSVLEVTQAEPFELQLAKGWNQIGNPYPFAVSWEAVRTANGNPVGLGALMTYNGEFMATSTLAAFRGAYVFSEGAMRLVFPLGENKTNSNGKTASQANGVSKYNLQKGNGWTVDFSLSSEKMKYRLGGLGMHSEADESKDIFDRIALPRLSEFIDLTFEHPEYFSPKFTKDIVPLQQNFIWNMEVASKGASKNITLEWNSDLELDSDMSLFLYDPEKESIVNMAEKNSYVVKSNQDLQVYYGSSEFLEEALQPKLIQIGEAYPNPFSQSISFSLALPKANHEAYRVQIKLYNTIGTEMQGSKTYTYQAGFHQMDVEAPANLARGIYFYTIRVVKNGQTLKEKTGRIVKL